MASWHRLPGTVEFSSRYCPFAAEDTLTRRRRVLGEDHPDTLLSANEFAADLHALGEHTAARQLNEDRLTRRHRVQGEDHLDTLRLANILADQLRHRRLGED
jgi:Tetratricopeptide repeat